MTSRTGVALAGSATAALLFTIACPPHEHWLLAWLVPGLFLVSARRLAPWRAALCGFTFGTLWGCTMAGWMREASLGYFGFNQAGAMGFVVLVAVVYAGIPNALLAYGYAGMAPRVRPWQRGLLGAWLWAASELFRTHVFTGLPWELLGHTQFQNLPVIQIADLGGVYAVSFVIALVSISLCEQLADRDVRSWSPGVVIGRLSPAAAVLVATLGYGMWCEQIHARPQHGEEKTVAVVQGNVSNTLRWKREFFERNLLTYARLTRQVGDADLIVWPENAVNFYIEREPALFPVLNASAAMAREGLVLGGPRMGEAGRSHNSLYLLGRDGGVRGTYDKRHLLPFAEYNPLRAVETTPLAGPIEFASGASDDLPRTPTATLGTLICYEMLFPSLVRDVIARGADLLVNVSNDSWLDDGSGAAPRQHFSMVVFSAVSARRYLVRASASGVSGLVSPYGMPYATIPRATRGTATGTVRLLSGQTPYVRWGESWIVIGGLLCVLLLAYERRRTPL